jgi:GNAT superfamily N-acetyltransferase/acyl carrier protein
MSGADVEDRLQHLVRSDLLAGSDRELPLNAPLGELGLDSLALVTFLTQVESSFGVALPDDVWVAREPLTLSQLAALVGAAGAEQVTRPPASAHQEILDRSERVERALSRFGVIGRLLFSLLLKARRLQRFVFTRDRNVVLERRLDDELAEPAPPEGVELRHYEPGDDLSGLWPWFEQESGRRDLAQALSQGAIALAAAQGDRIVALDLVSAEGEIDVRLTEQRAACYGYRLDVSPAVRGSGVGAALLAYSLRVARERGFRSQLTFVHEDNRQMLVTATHTLGFRPVGRAVRTSVVGRTRWSWDVQGRRGAGPALLL